MGDLPKSLTLPARGRVELALRDGPTTARGEKGPRLSTAAMGAVAAPRFAEAIEIFDSRVVVTGDGKKIDVRDLPLGDFHVLRAVALKHGVMDEDEIEVDCSNCGALLRVRPCAGLEIAPWENGEIADPELDRTLPFDAPLPTGAGDLTLASRTVRDVLPLFGYLAKPELDVDAGAVEAMGISALGEAKEPAAIAAALMECDDDAFATVTNAWLDAHYVPRLAADVVCDECKARNTVDAPYLREFDRGLVRADSHAPNAPLPGIDEFVEIAHALAEPLLRATAPGEFGPPELVVDDGTPAVDDGGVPLLGSYVPPPPKDAPVPTGPGTITVYYQTFAACVADEPGFDWEAELHETIAHELEHHVYWLRGDDPMDDAERAAIAADAVRLVGKTEATKRELEGFGASFPDFVKRAWPLILIAAIAAILSVSESRCTPGSR